MSLAEEIERRARRLSFSAEALCHAPQLSLVRSQAKRKVARCGRRSGKTTGTAIALLERALQPPYANQGYVTLSLKNARRIIWPTLVKLNEHYGLGGVPNETEAYMRFPHLPNQPNIYLGGCKDQSEVDKIRGWEGGAKSWVVDEAQSMRTSLLQGLIDDAIEPSLFDWDGELIVQGTPGPVKAGYFYDIDQGDLKDGWEHFFWTLLENPFLEAKSGKPPEQILAELRERRKWSEDHPTYRREYLGQWVDDPDSLVLRYSSDRNHYDSHGDLRSFVIGVDIGHDDADAIAVLGWGEGSSQLYLVEEHVKRGATVSDLAERIAQLRHTYSPRKIVADFGGLGKKISAEIAQRWGLPIEAADKARKVEHVALLDDALRTGVFMAKKDSHFAQDCALVQWDTDAKARGTLKIADEPHSDICDAVLYAYRACLQYRHTPPAPAKSPTDVMDDWEREEAERIEARSQGAWWERY